MEITAIVVGTIFAIVASNVLSHLFPKLPLSLLLIAFGCIMGVILLEEPLLLNPELFLSLVIAPLLFRDADEADFVSLWKVKSPVMIMAFLLVFITVFAVGFSVKLLLPLTPLAACFALGAILGPTDAVAVSSLSSRFTFGERITNILKGEGLINDASGLTALRFASVALISGSFSAPKAALSLLWVTLGGFLVGYLLTSAEQYVIKILKRVTVRQTSTYILVELIMPFLTYAAAEFIGVSGIIAAVVSGIRQTSKNLRAESISAEVGIAKESIWHLLSSCLNSIVFLLLGLELPHIVTSVWNDPRISKVMLIAPILLITLVVWLVRFISVALLVRDESVRISGRLKNVLLITLSGAKGTVSLAAAFALPIYYSNGERFSERPLLMFITAGVIILSLVVALFVLPLIADDAEEEEVSESDVQIRVLREVIDRLRKRPDVKLKDVVLLGYKRRIDEIEYSEFTAEERRELHHLQQLLFRVEKAVIEEHYQANLISYHTYRNAIGLLFFVYRGDLSRAAIQSTLWTKRPERLFHKRQTQKHIAERIDELEQENEFLALFRDESEMLVVTAKSNSDRFPAKIINRVIRDRDDIYDEIHDGVFGKTLQTLYDNEYYEAMLMGFYVERQVIHDFLDSGKITDEHAATLRMNVNRMELYILSGDRDETAQEINSIFEIQSDEPEAADDQTPGEV
ncbi:MAG: sodium:proton antiporter [Oscillospiraceae bacterium]|jgi:CPA1 family monovalent cation:H+ antiporter|nr:sodium:proton antiporter [Oscillospiraceae bacterium]